MCTLSCELNMASRTNILPKDIKFECLNTIFGLWPSVQCGTAVVWIPIGRGEQGFFFAVWSTSKPIKLFEMFAYVTLPNGV